MILTKMYYIPSAYYFLEENNIYKDIITVIEKDLEYNKFIHDRKTIDKKLVEKTPEYIKYKSCLIKVILAKYTHTNKDVEGKVLIDDIMNKWNNNEKISKKYRELKFELTKTRISKYEKEINNIEKILMLSCLEILENYYN